MRPDPTNNWLLVPRRLENRPLWLFKPSSIVSILFELRRTAAYLRMINDELPIPTAWAKGIVGRQFFTEGAAIYYTPRSKRWWAKNNMSYKELRVLELNPASLLLVKRLDAWLDKFIAAADWIEHLLTQLRLLLMEEFKHLLPTYASAIQLTDCPEIHGSILAILRQYDETSTPVLYLEAVLRELEYGYLNCAWLISTSSISIAIRSSKLVIRHWAIYTRPVNENNNLGERSKPTPSIGTIYDNLGQRALVKQLDDVHLTSKLSLWQTLAMRRRTPNLNDELHKLLKRTSLKCIHYDLRQRARIRTATDNCSVIWAEASEAAGGWLKYNIIE